MNRSPGRISSRSSHTFTPRSTSAAFSAMTQGLSTLLWLRKDVELLVHRVPTGKCSTGTAPTSASEGAPTRIADRTDERQRNRTDKRKGNRTDERRGYRTDKRWKLPAAAPLLVGRAGARPRHRARRRSRATRLRQAAVRLMRRSTASRRRTRNRDVKPPSPYKNGSGNTAGKKRSTLAWATPFEVPPATRTPPLCGRSTASDPDDPRSSASRQSRSSVVASAVVDFR